VSQLKQFTLVHTPVFSELLATPCLNLAELEPESILDRRLAKKGNSAIVQVLVKWKSLPATLATWEDYFVLKKTYPADVAWGHAASQEGGDVITDR
jgi:hypothetical protein